MFVRAESVSKGSGTASEVLSATDTQLRVGQGQRKMIADEVILSQLYESTQAEILHPEATRLPATTSSFELVGSK